MDDVAFQTMVSLPPPAKIVSLPVPPSKVLSCRRRSGCCCRSCPSIGFVSRVTVTLAVSVRLRSATVVDGVGEGATRSARIREGHGAGIGRQRQAAEAVGVADGGDVQRRTVGIGVVRQQHPFRNHDRAVHDVRDDRVVVRRSSGSLTATTLTVVVATLLFMNPSFTVTWITRLPATGLCELLSNVTAWIARLVVGKRRRARQGHDDLAVAPWCCVGDPRRQVADVEVVSGLGVGQHDPGRRPSAPHRRRCRGWWRSPRPRRLR